MPTVISITLYEIDELEDKAKATAIDRIREIGLFDAEPDTLTEYMKWKLQEYGLPDTVEWSLSYCQGDGVAFYGDIDIKQCLRAIGELGEYENLIFRYGLTATSKKNSWGTHYSHYNTMDVYLERESDYTTHAHMAQAAKLWELIKLRVQSVSRELEKWGYERIAYNQGAEYIMECVQESDPVMLFKEDGRLWNP